MSYYERYQAGEHAAVWDELTWLGGAAREPALFGNAASAAQVNIPVRRRRLGSAS